MVSKFTIKNLRNCRSKSYRQTQTQCTCVNLFINNVFTKLIDIDIHIQYTYTAIDCIFSQQTNKSIKLMPLSSFQNL